LILWYGLMAAGGFGVVGDQRPFGEGVLFHPLVIFFVLVGVVLLALRIVLARPGPEVRPRLDVWLRGWPCSVSRREFSGNSRVAALRELVRALTDRLPTRHSTSCRAQTNAD
jgi:hypothetical protein